MLKGDETFASNYYISPDFEEHRFRVDLEYRDFNASVMNSEESDEWFEERMDYYEEFCNRWFFTRIKCKSLTSYAADGYSRVKYAYYRLSKYRYFHLMSRYEQDVEGEFLGSFRVMLPVLRRGIPFRKKYIK